MLQYHSVQTMKCTPVKKTLTFLPFTSNYVNFNIPYLNRNSNYLQNDMEYIFSLKILVPPSLTCNETYTISHTYTMVKSYYWFKSQLYAIYGKILSFREMCIPSFPLY